MEVDRNKMVKVLNDLRGLIHKLSIYNQNQTEKDINYFYIDRIGLEIKLIYCDFRDLVLSDAWLRTKMLQQLNSSNPEHHQPVLALSTQLD